MNISKQDKIEIREILNKLTDQINVMEMQCDSMMEIMAEVKKDLDLSEVTE